uniref:Uncharacterized protein n=1 Tax=viral metagenome TaxID=1070528 RepID=A0A6C0L9D5_9ZZZZ
MQFVSIHKKNVTLWMVYGIKMESVQKRLEVPIPGIVATRPARPHHVPRVVMIHLNWMQYVSIHKQNVKV